MLAGMASLIDAIKEENQALSVLLKAALVEPDGGGGEKKNRTPNLDDFSFGPSGYNQIMNWTLKVNEEI